MYVNDMRKQKNEHVLMIASQLYHVNDLVSTDPDIISLFNVTLSDIKPTKSGKSVTVTFAL